MKFWQAMRELLDGKKVRKVSWNKELYVYMGIENKPYLAYSSNNSSHIWMDYVKDAIDFEEWEIYRPTVKFKNIPIGEYFQYLDGTCAYKVKGNNINVIILNSGGTFLTCLKSDNDDVIYPVDKAK